jgi:ubiquinone/menaquinone biosynthesis C-methylase UbiE
VFAPIVLHRDMTFQLPSPDHDADQFPDSTWLLVGCLFAVTGFLIVVLGWPQAGFVLVGSGATLVGKWLVPFAKRRLREFRLLRTSGAYDGAFDPKHDGDLVSGIIESAIRQYRRSLSGSSPAQSSPPTQSHPTQPSSSNTLRIMGTTLHSLLGYNGLLADRFKELEKEDARFQQIPIRVLIANPISTMAVVRSIAESIYRYPDERDDEPYQLLLRHTEAEHVNCLMYKNSCEVMEHILRLRSRGWTNLQCRVFNTSSSVFSIWTNRKCVLENLVLKENRDNDGKISGELPLIAYKPGRVHSAVKADFDFVWDTLSIPLEHFDLNLERSGYLTSVLPLLLGLQRRYWENAYSQDRKSKTEDWSPQIINDHLLNCKGKYILDLGCGDGGGGALEIARYCSEHGHHFHAVDISSNAIKRFREKLGDASKRVELHSEDMHMFLMHQKDEDFDLIYANISLIYMPRARAKEIIRQIHRCLRNGGVFIARVFSSKYFEIPSEKERVDESSFSRFPVAEDLRVISKGSRIGEIRRFYLDEADVRAELLDEPGRAAFKEVHCSVSTCGPHNQTFHIQARKDV